MNFKYQSMAGVLILVVLLTGVTFIRADIDSMRARYAISPDAVIMFTRSDCGSLCTDRATNIRSLGIEVVTLDIHDETAGSHLWEALGGGNASVPAFLMGGSNRLHAVRASRGDVQQEITQSVAYTNQASR